MKIQNLSFYLKYENLLLALLPFSIILGNLVLNLNIIFIILLYFYFNLKNIFSIKILKKFNFLLIFLILFLVLNASFSENLFLTLKGQLGLIKHLILYSALCYFFLKDDNTLKMFISILTIVILFTLFDTFWQFLFTKDLFGYYLIESHGNRLSGPFGDELIAGGYLLRFSIFSIFLVPLFYKKIPARLLYFIIPFLVCTFIAGIILSGNRMPLIMYVFTLLLIIIFQKQTRKYLIVFMATSLIVFSITYKFNLKVKNNFDNFYYQISKMVELIYTKDFYNEKAPDHLKEFASFYNTWKMNKYIGGGIKNFWYYCAVEQTLRKNSLTVCNTHPHNYYLEIITETGLLGLIVFLAILIQILLITFYKKYFTNSSLQNNNVLIPFIFLFLCEIFPLKSTGSIFTTNNATYLFLLISILIGISNQEKLIENKK